MYLNNLIYSVYDEKSYEKMMTGIKAKEKELDNLKRKLFQTARVKQQINFIETDIKGAKKACNDYFVKKRQSEIEQKAVVYRITDNVTGTTFRKSEVNNAIKFIIEDCGFEYYDGLTNKEIEEEFSRVYRYSGFFTNNFNLVRETENEFDKNAVAVYISDFHIGYLSKGEAKNVSKVMDDNTVKVKGMISIIGGTYKEFDYYEDKIISVKDNAGFKIQATILDRSLLWLDKKAPYRPPRH